MSSRPVNTSRFRKTVAQEPVAPELEVSEDKAVDYDEMKVEDSIDDKASNKGKRKFEELVKVPKKLSTAALMEESMRTVSAIPIPESSKGFKLLAKFGYTKGIGLGKCGEGITEPLQVNNRVGSDKTGLGVLEMKKRVVDEKVRDQQRNTEERAKLLEQFKRDISDSMKLQRMSRAVLRAERVIMELDSREDLESHSLWPEDHQHGSDGTIDTVTSSDETQPTPTTADIPLLLTERLEYLRDRYNYCLYCGCQYESAEEIDSLCPGLFEDDH